MDRTPPDHLRAVAASERPTAPSLNGLARALDRDRKANEQRFNYLQEQLDEIHREVARTQRAMSEQMPAYVEKGRTWIGRDLWVQMEDLQRKFDALAASQKDSTATEPPNSWDDAEEWKDVTPDSVTVRCRDTRQALWSESRQAWLVFKGEGEDATPWTQEQFAAQWEVVS